MQLLSFFVIIEGRSLVGTQEVTVSLSARLQGSRSLSGKLCAAYCYARGKRFEEDRLSERTVLCAVGPLIPEP